MQQSSYEMIEKMLIGLFQENSERPIYLSRFKSGKVSSVQTTERGLREDETHEQIDIKRAFLMCHIEMYPDYLFEARVLYMNRVLMGLSLQEVGDALGITRQAVSQFERGKRKVPNPIAISNFIGFLPDEWVEEYWNLKE